MPHVYEPMFPLGTHPGQTRTQRRVYFLHNAIRDSITIPGWLSIGALIQMVLFLLPVKRYLAALPFALYVVFHTTDALLVTFGFKRNTFMDHVIQRKYSGFMPDASGHFSHLNADRESSTSSAEKGSNAGDEDTFIVFNLGFRVNHPLGVLAPGAREVGKYFLAMQQELETDHKTYGMLGSTGYTTVDARSTGNELNTRFYFRNHEHLHRFAHGPTHRKGWDWLESAQKRWPYLAVSHESFVVKANSFETIYLNWEPNGFAATKHLRKGQNGEDVYVSPLVDVSKGKLATSKGRMGLP